MSPPLDELREKVSAPKLRRLEMIGEAVKGIPDEFRLAYPDTPWSDIAGARPTVSQERKRW